MAVVTDTAGDVREGEALDHRLIRQHEAATA